VLIRYAGMELLDAVLKNTARAYYTAGQTYAYRCSCIDLPVVMGAFQQVHTALFGSQAQPRLVRCLSGRCPDGHNSSDGGQGTQSSTGGGRIEEGYLPMCECTSLQ